MKMRRGWRLILPFGPLRWTTMRPAGRTRRLLRVYVRYIALQKAVAMAKTAKLTPGEQVADYVSKLDQERAEVVNALREIIMSAAAEVGEQVKWNSPSFCFTGEIQAANAKEYPRDIVVLNLHRPDYVLLVFPTGAKINDTSGLLEGSFPDGRKTIRISSVPEAESKREALQSVVRQWLSLVERP